MDFQGCINFANENPVCCLATIDGDQPRVRKFELWFAEKDGFYFHTAGSKNIVGQLKNNPKVEVCFYSPESSDNVGIMMRVTGEAEFMGDIGLKTRLFEEKPFLKAIGSGLPEDPLVTVFRIFKGEVYFWEMKDNMKEKEIQKIKF